MFDFSNYLTKSKYYHNSNRLVIGMRDENGGIAIEDFVGLKPRMYSVLIKNSKNEIVKGIYICMYTK